MKRAAIAKAKSCLRLPNLSHKYCSCKISHNLNILLRKELWKCQKEHNVKVIMFRWKKVTEIRDIKTSKLIRGHTIRCENVENDSMTLSMWQYQTCKNHKESKCFAILYHNGYFHKGTAFVWQTLPNLASKHYVYQPHQISYLEQLLKTHWAKRMTFSIFNVPKAKPPKKHSQRPHLEQLDTLCLQGSIFNPAKLIVNLKIVRIFNLSAPAALFWSGGRIRTSSINQSSSQLPKYYPQCIEECE